jgi:hypothetical protein
MNRDKFVAGGVAGAAFACSATHIFSVALASGNPAFIAGVHPIGLDGLIYIGMRAVSNGRRWQGWLATIYGVAMSLTFNVVSYAHVSMPPAVMAMAMPLALVLGVLVIGHGHEDKTAPVDMDTEAVSTPVVHAAVSEPVSGFALSDVLPAAVVSSPSTFRVPAVAAPVFVPQLDAKPAAPRPARGKVDEAEAKELVMAALEAGVMKLGEVDALLGGYYETHPRTIRRLRERLGLVSVSAVPALEA